MIYADVEEVNALIKVAPSYQQSVAPHVWLGSLCHRHGRDHAAWLSRCPPRRRRDILTWLDSATVPRLSQSFTLPVQTPRDSHTLVAVPKASWPRSAKETQATGVMLLFGTLGGETLGAVAETFIVTLHGNVQANDQLEATLEALDAHPPPPMRLGHAAMWMQDLDSMVVYGGRCSTAEAEGTALGDVWLLEQVRTVPHQLTWRWLQLKAEAQLPKARAHFASCALSGRSFFVHGGQSCVPCDPCDGVLDDAWVCWIDDGFEAAYCDFDACTVPGCCCCCRHVSQSSEEGQPAPLRKQLSEQLTQQASLSQQNLAPRMSTSELFKLSGPVMPNTYGDLQTVAQWRRIETDGEPPPKCYGHSATCSSDGIIIHGLCSGAEMAHCLGPIHVLEGLSDPTSEAGINRAHYTRLQSSLLSCHREWATLHTVLGRPVLVGGWDSNDQASSAWHASCKLPLSKHCCPTIVIFGGCDHSGTTCGDLLVVSWKSARSPGVFS